MAPKAAKAKDKTLKYEGRMSRFDITIPFLDGDGKPNYVDWEALHTKLTSWCSKFSFQKERSEPTEKNPDGYLHWQVRINLIKRKYSTDVLTQVVPCVGGSWSVTSNGVHSNGNSFNYVMKEDSRVDGPWTDEIVVEKPAVMTRQLKNFLENIVEKDLMYSWQKQMLEELKKVDDRWINHICDMQGNSGKSMFCEYLEYLKLGNELPMFNDMQDLSAFAFSFPTRKAYFIDMPRGIDKRKMDGLYSGIETLKNGFIFDKRFKGQKKRFDRPQICTFGNAFPDVRLLIQDRWKIWMMCEEDNPENEGGRFVGDRYLKSVSIQYVLDQLVREEAPKKRGLPEALKPAKKAKKQ
jgi:hypothetical protein